MTVDLSDCADRTTLDGIAASTKPPVFTHAAARALMPGYPRCKTDEAIRALAAKGGVIGIGFIRFMIRPEPPVTVEHVVDHVEHVIRLVGPEHVGIGSDLEGSENGPPTGTAQDWCRFIGRAADAAWAGRPPTFPPNGCNGPIRARLQGRSDGVTSPRGLRGEYSSCWSGSPRLRRAPGDEEDYSARRCSSASASSSAIASRSFGRPAARFR
jgi:hypothetical protein